jgi:hypothetical protein
LKTIIDLVLAIVFLSLAAIHVYWAFGGKGAAAATVPSNLNNKPIISPGPVDCMVVALGLLGFCVFVLIRSGILLIGLPGWLLNYGLWAIAALFLLRAMGEFKYVGFFKKIKSTQFGQMDTKYYSPLCLLIAVLAVILEIIA